MKEVFENIKEKIKNQPIEQFVDTNGNWDLVQTVLDCCCEAVDRVKEEYNNGWIPASEPPKCFMLSDGRLIPFLVCDKLMWNPYIAFYNGKEWCTALEKLNPTAYMPLPPAYVPEEGRE